MNEKKNNFMRKFFLLLISLFFVYSLFGQSHIGETKKHIMNSLKSEALEIGKPEKTNNGYYDITIRFKNNVNIYSFTNENICYFYIVVEKYSYSTYLNYVNFYNERFLKVGNEDNVWKEAKGDIFIYRWIIHNMNKEILYILYLTKENYEKNKFSYLELLLE